MTGLCGALHGAARRLGRLVLVVVAASAPGAAQEPDLIDFELQDQFERTWRDDDFSGRATVVLVGNRGGAEFNQAWGRALFTRMDGTPLEERVALVPVADAQGVPFFLKGAVRGALSDDPERWVLLDWEGRFDAEYALVDGHANLLVFGPDGTFRRHMVVQEVVPELLDDLVGDLRAAVGADGAPPEVSGGAPHPDASGGHRSAASNRHHASRTEDQT